MQIHTYDPVEWPDSCLGAANAGEVCAQAVTAGFGGMLIANGIKYEFHSDRSGASLRLIPGPALSARQVLARQLHLDLSQIALVSAEPVGWPDSCLGVQLEGMSCAQVITPGYKVVLEAGSATSTIPTRREARCCSPAPHFMRTYAPFMAETPAKAHAMSIRLVFSGIGSKEATDAGKQAIRDFAAGV